MDIKTEKVYDNVTTIISLWEEYSNLSSEVMNAADDGWHRRMVQIYNDEAPTTLTKLILGLRLQESPHLSFRSYNDNEVEYISVVRSIIAEPKTWEDAYSKYGDGDETKFRHQQLADLVSNMHLAMVNIQQL